MNKPKPKLGPIGIRAALLRIHTDLLRIHRRVDTWADYRFYEFSNLEKMVVVLEDRRFFNHAGIDLISCARELSRALIFRRHGGASTIDMQFVRTATGYYQKTIGRKLYEMLLTILIQYRYSKIVILRSYLDHAFFGSHLIGADKAAEALFGLGHDELNVDQAARLAAMLVYPRPLQETPAWSRRVERRARYGVSIYLTDKKRFDKIPI
jgi:membrane peptidoglycan carboxypeptidase